LPVAEALIMAGKGTPKTLKTSEDILLVMGEFFQIQVFIIIYCLLLLQLLLLFFIIIIRTTS
jgi:hypothetical protein